MASDTKRFAIALRAAGDDLPKLTNYPEVDPPRSDQTTLPRIFWTGTLAGIRRSKLMIHLKDKYYAWIESRGVGSNDSVASSPDSYAAYLNSVSKLIGRDISPELLSTVEDIDRIARSIEGRRLPKTITNYKSAMRQYVAMVRAEVLSK